MSEPVLGLKLSEPVHHVIDLVSDTTDLSLDCLAAGIQLVPVRDKRMLPIVATRVAVGLLFPRHFGLSQVVLSAQYCRILWAAVKCQESGAQG